MLLMGKLTISMAIFNSYVKLPEGIYFGGYPLIYKSWFINPGLTLHIWYTIYIFVFSVDNAMMAPSAPVVITKTLRLSPGRGNNLLGAPGTTPGDGETQGLNVGKTPGKHRKKHDKHGKNIGKHGKKT